MKFKDHQERLKESLEVIEDCIEKGVVERQRTIGFNISAASADMLEMLLHKNNLIDPGFVIKHDWFNSERKVGEKLDFDFPNKKGIIKLMCAIEFKRNILCYGKTQKSEVLEEAIHDFTALKNIFKELGVND